MTAFYDFAGVSGKLTQKPIKCDADEWPPAYFRNAQNTQQVVRYLPQSENRGAGGKLWGAWCDKNDGGKGNGQYHDDARRMGQLNEALVKPTGKQLGQASTKTDKGTTTTYVTYAAEYTRAVFSMVFDWQGSDLGGAPSEANSWGLKLNPCWPEALVPEDPGWCLKTDDPWYEKHTPKLDQRKLYDEAPNNELVAMAEGWMAQHPDKVLMGHKDGTFDKPGAPKRQHSNDQQDANKKPMAGSSGAQQRRRRRSLNELLNDPVVFANIQLNSTSDDEHGFIGRAAQAEYCNRRSCSNDQPREETQEGVRMMRARRRLPRMSPPDNIEAEATNSAPSQLPEPTPPIERRAVSPQSHVVMTGVPTV